MTAETSVSVIGLGPRGLGVLERLISLSRRLGPALGRLRIDVIDPTCSGRGVHVRDQPDYLRLHSPAAYITMFPDSATLPQETASPGPSLLEWAISSGFRVARDGLTVGSRGRPVRGTDFLPRWVLGEYLHWFTGHLLQTAPSQVRVRLHEAEALDIDRDSHHRFVVVCTGGRVVTAEHVFITTGYAGGQRPADAVSGRQRQLVQQPYPLPGATAAVRARESVGVTGFGLSALDVVTSMTVGRGGRFRSDGSGIRYLPSGHEPVILLASRSGVPCRVRPPLAASRPSHPPRFLTADAVTRLKSDCRGFVDFERDVMPLVSAEMRLAYRRAQLRSAGRLDVDELVGTTSTQGLRQLLDQWEVEFGHFDARAAFDGSSGMDRKDSAGYQAWVAGSIRDDLQAAESYPAGSPLKCAIEVLVDLFETIQDIVGQDCLTDSALDRFTELTGPAIRRAAVGPYYERQRELLALMDVGVVAAPFGPSPTFSWCPRAGGWAAESTGLARPDRRRLDWIVAGHVTTPGVDGSASPLVAALRDKGWIRKHRSGAAHVHAVDVDERWHPRDRDGLVNERMWVLGPLCEGATYYNHVLPKPHTYSPCVADAHSCVSELFARHSRRRRVSNVGQ